MTPNEALKAAKEALDKALSEKKQNQELLRTLGPAIIDVLKPVLEELAKSSKITKQEIMDAVSSITIQVPEIASPSVPDIKIPDIKVPEPKVIVNFDTSKIKLPEIKIPAIKVPKPEVTVNIPEITIPDLMWPKDAMPIKGDIRLLGIDLSHPLPVQLRDAKGNPIDLSKLGGSSVIMSGGGGGKADFFTIKDIQTSAGVSIIDQEDGAMKVVGSLSATLSLPSGPGDSATATRILQAGDSVSSVNILQIASSPVVVGSGYQDNALRVVNATDAVTSVQSKVLARTTNPTAAGDATSTFQGSDKLGRALYRPIQVRELVSTAYVSVANGTEVTLIAAPAATYLDLIYLMGTNNSDAAVAVDIRDATAGGIVATINIPASSMAGLSPKVPIPQNTLAASWTVDLPDITGTTVTISALFSKEI